ncbi:hypothetical protein E2C01_073240 [Portunus trituberculatus]|uniref:Uncharacterized protein n=1 Tax=Portunus trituberculatus TaxID=210409 RepID=A0A5B7I8X2_PORTR|nr:hypothetical protein [Portunus trituberculatus]
MTIKVDHSDVLIARVTGICVPHVRLVYTAAVPSIRRAGAVIGRCGRPSSINHHYRCTPAAGRLGGAARGPATSTRTRGRPRAPGGACRRAAAHPRSSPGAEEHHDSLH